jgi:hypothetical protein
MKRETLERGQEGVEVSEGKRNNEDPAVILMRTIIVMTGLWSTADGPEVNATKLKRDFLPLGEYFDFPI